MRLFTILTPIMIVSVAGLMSACSRSTEAIATPDVFAPGAEIAVPAPAPLDINAGVNVAPPVIGAPPPIQAGVGIQQGQFAQNQFAQVPGGPLIAPPVIAQPPAVEIPPNVTIPPQQIAIPAPPAPEIVATPTYPPYDCSSVPASKGGLALYRQNCL